MEFLFINDSELRTFKFTLLLQPSTETAGTASPLPGGAHGLAGGSSGDGSDQEQKLKLQLAAQKEMENRLRKKEFGSKREGEGGVAGGDALAGERVVGTGQVWIKANQGDRHNHRWHLFA